jgi:hypothetical protein
MPKKLEEFEASETATALAYIRSYAKKHPDVFKSAKLPNSAKKFNRKRFAETVETLMEPFAKVVGKNYAK